MITSMGKICKFVVCTSEIIILYTSVMFDHLQYACKIVRPCVELLLVGRGN